MTPQASDIEIGALLLLKIAVQAMVDDPRIEAWGDAGDDSDPRNHTYDVPGDRWVHVVDALKAVELARTADET